MSRYARLLLLVLFLGACSQAPRDHAVSMDAPRALHRALKAASASFDQARADSLYGLAEARGWIPLVYDSTAVFLYRGMATTRIVEIRGDMNGWGGEPKIVLEPVAGTTLFASDAVMLPPGARLDYKVVADGRWIQDPGNPRRCWGGFGPNTEFSMPDYEPSPWVQPGDAPRGRRVEDRRIDSRHLGYEVSYSLHLPPGYDPARSYPALFVTDGHEYADPRLGALPIVADNLLDAGLIEPLILVFVDPRDVETRSRNRRQEQYACNPDFAAFLAGELYPAVAADWPLRPGPESTGILGTSFGGVCSAFVGLTRPETFGLVAMQSPAIRFKSTDNTNLLRLYEDSPRVPLSRIWMDAGYVQDTHEPARRFLRLLSEKGYTGVEYREVPEGHSWGSWRARLDEVLMHLFPAKG